MNRAFRALALAGVLLGSLNPLMCRINFSSQQSGIAVDAGARFNVSSSNLAIDGTLHGDNAAAISGNDISFNRGVLDQNGTEVEMTGFYVPTGSDALELRGNGRFKAEPGTVIHQLTLLMTGNRLEGQPLFQQPILLTDSSTSLTIAIQNKLNQDISLNGGTLQLDDDLRLTDDSRVNGPGIVKLNKRQLSLGGFYSAPWTGALVFDHATDVALNGHVQLDGQWTFSGTSNLNGHGSVLDLTNGGTIFVTNGSTLYLNDVYIKGLGDPYNYGKIVFGNHNSCIRTSGSYLEFEQDYNVPTGGFYVDGDTTFVLKENNLIFDQHASLTVDGATLWLDVNNFDLTTPGQLRVPLPVFVEHVWSTSGVAYDTAVGTLTLLNTGTIKETADKSLVAASFGCDDDCLLLSGSITTTLNLKKSVLVPADKIIKVDANVCINGNGQTVYFSHPKHPQFIVSENVTVILKNIDFTRIRSNTFDLRPGARVYVERCVGFELSEDMTFSSGRLKVLDIPGGNIFNIRGLAGRKRFLVKPLIPTHNILDLGQNSILLNAIEFSGFDSVLHRNAELFGTFGLSGESAAAIDADTAMNFFIEGIGNEILLLNDEINLSGAITFGDFAANFLHIKTAITAPILAKPDVNIGFPLLVLSGDPGIFVASEFGEAGVFLDDLSIAIQNDAGNSFVFDVNSFLVCKNLQILGNDIKQSSPLFGVEALSILGGKINPSFVRSPALAHEFSSRPVSAIHLMRERERQAFAASSASAKAQSSHYPTSHKNDKKKENKSKKKKSKTHHRYAELLGLEIQDFDFDDYVIRGQKIKRRRDFIQVPADEDLDVIYDGTLIIPTEEVTGNVLVRNGGRIENFQVDPDVVLNLTLQDGASLSLGDNDVELTDNHIINIVGSGNVIEIGGSLTLNNQFFIDEGAELTFIFTKSTDPDIEPQLLFPGVNSPDDGISLDISPNAKIVVEGSGSVIMGDYSFIHFIGNKIAAGSAASLQCGTTRAAIVGVADRPSFILRDEALLHIEEDAQVSINGVGQFEVTHKALIDIDLIGTLLFGGSSDDDIDVYFSEAAGIRISPAEPSDEVLAKFADENLTDDEIASRSLGRVAFRNLTSLISFEQGGNLFIDDAGLFEINAFDGDLERGSISFMSFGHGGMMHIADGGRLSCGPNADNTMLVPNDVAGVGAGAPFDWIGAQFMITGIGSGLVEFVGRPEEETNGVYEGFIGQLKAANSSLLFSTGTELTMGQLVRLLIQQNAALQTAIEFIDDNGNRQLRTRTGVIVPLQPGDIILSDNVATGVVIGQASSGVSFTINANGVRS